MVYKAMLRLIVITFPSHDAGVSVEYTVSIHQVQLFFPVNCPFLVLSLSMFIRFFLPYFILQY